MKRKIYIETSIISYLTTRPSNDPIKSACQQITRLWWDAGRASVSAFISPYVVEEASAGDSIAAGERCLVLATREYAQNGGGEKTEGELIEGGRQ